jgi:hypothetical protein
VEPILAHVLSGGGPLNVVLLLAGAALAVGGIRLKDRRPAAATWGRVLLWSGIALFALGLILDAGPAPTSSRAAVRFVEPTDGAEVPADAPVPVVVEVRNGVLALSADDANGGHLHLFVDGQVRRMPYANRTEITLTPGGHELTVEYVDARHASFSPRVSATIRVTAT